MKKDTRYEIRKAQKNKIIVRRSYDIDSFIKMWHDNALHRGFWIPFKKEIKALYEAFGKNSYLLLAYQIPLRLRSGQADPEFTFDFAQGKQIPNSKSPISGALILVSHKIAYYFHAASTSEGRQLSAPSLIVWEAMKLAKEKGCKTFDFEGILDPRDKNTNKWGGFTHFKKGFGGREVVYPLTITKYYNPIVKFLFSFFG
jgi:lipid II:glycine glycyltransferase (peptidoglycan interpeptide bridge formation enzyme)